MCVCVCVMNIPDLNENFSQQGNKPEQSQVRLWHSEDEGAIVLQKSA